MVTQGTSYRLGDTLSPYTIPDGSNYTVNLTLAEAVNWRDNLGVPMAIVQAVNPPPGYPAGKTQEQIEILLQVGIKVGVYFYHWYEDSPNGLENRIALIEPYRGAIDSLYNDVEDVNTGLGWSVQARIDNINRANDRIGQFPSEVGQVRGYSGKWYINGYLGGRTDYFEQWWLSQYDSIRNANVIALPGNLTIDQVVLKQYVGTSNFGTMRRKFSDTEYNIMKNFDEGRTLDPNDLTVVRQANRGRYRWGMVGGLDLSVPGDQEAARLAGDSPQDPCQDVTTDRNSLVSALGWLGKDALTQSGLLKLRSKAAKAYIDQVYTVCDQHSIEHA